MTVKKESNIQEQHQQSLFSWNMIDLTTIQQRISKAEKYPQLIN